VKKKRLLLFGGFLADCVCLPLGMVAMMPPSHGVTKANFDRIEVGMTAEEVVGILGPHATETENGETVAMVTNQGPSD
jgi:hypothetical protein